MTLKNPLLIPKAAPKKRCCPKCGSENFNGRKISGMIIFTCSVQECRTQFGGGLPIEPHDPSRPLPPVDPKDRPTVDFVPSRHDNAVEGWREVRRRPSSTPDFRTGAYIPPEEE